MGGSTRCRVVWGCDTSGLREKQLCTALSSTANGNSSLKEEKGSALEYGLGCLSQGISKMLMNVPKLALGGKGASVEDNGSGKLETAKTRRECGLSAGTPPCGGTRADRCKHQNKVGRVSDTRENESATHEGVRAGA